MTVLQHLSRFRYKERADIEDTVLLGITRPVPNRYSTGIHPGPLSIDKRAN